MEESSRQWLYKTLQKEGYNVGKDQAEFDSLMTNNAESRKWAYETASSLGYNVGKDQSEFDSLINPPADTSSQPESPTPTVRATPQPQPENGYVQPKIDAAMIAKPDDRSDLQKTIDQLYGSQQQRNEQQAQQNDDYWRNDPTMQRRAYENRRNGILLDPTVPRDQRGIQIGQQNPSLLDLSNPKFANIIKNDEVVKMGMGAFEEALKQVQDEGRQSIMDRERGKGLLENAAAGMSPDGYMGDMAGMREASEKGNPSKAIKAAVDQMTAHMLKDDYFTSDGENLNDAGRMALQSMQQAMVQKLVEQRMPKNSAEYVVLNAFRNSDFGKLTRLATESEFNRYLDDLAMQMYQPGFWEKVGMGTLTFGLNMPEYLLTGVAGGALSQGLTKGMANMAVSGLTKRGIERGVAERAVQMMMQNGVGNKVANIGGHAVSGATTFGLQPVIGTPIDLTYKAGQPLNEDGSVYTPSLDEYIGETFKEMKKGAAMGSLMVGGAAAGGMEKIVQGAAKEGVGRELAGLGYDAGVMAGFSLADMKEANPDFEITPKTAAEAFAESAMSLSILKSFGLLKAYRKEKDRQEFIKKFNFTPEEREYLKEMGIENPVDLAIKMAGGKDKGGVINSIMRDVENRRWRKNGDKTAGTDVAIDDAEQVDAENIEQLDEVYRSFMDSPAPETMKAKVMYLMEGKMPASFSPVTGTRIVDVGGKVYLETLNEQGGIIERKPMKDFAEAQAEANKIGYDVDVNTTAAMERRLDEMETANDMRAMFDEEYQRIQAKVANGEKLTAEDRETLAMVQNIPAILQWAQNGNELTQAERILMQKAIDELEAYKQTYNAPQRIAEELESEKNVPHGALKKALEGMTKEEAQKVAGDNIIEVGNGIYRTAEDQALVEEYRNRMLQRINEHENGKAQAEAQASEGAPEQPIATGEERVETQQPDTAENSENSTEFAKNSTEFAKNDTEFAKNDTEIAKNPAEISENGEIVADIDAARQRGKDVYFAQDRYAIRNVGHELKLADARMEKNFAPDQVKAIEEAINAGVDPYSIIEGNLTPMQKEAIEKYKEAHAVTVGITDAMKEKRNKQVAVDQTEVEPYQSEQGEIIPLKLRNGQTVYYKSGDLDNTDGTVNVVYADENGQTRTRDISTSDITERGTAMPTEEFAMQLSTEQLSREEQQTMDWLLGNYLEKGDKMMLTIAGETAPFYIESLIMGPDDGQLWVQMHDADGEQTAFTKQEVLEMMEATEQLQIEGELHMETVEYREAQRQQREAARQEEIKQRTERYETGIVGMKEGNPDLTNKDTDAKVAAEFMLGDALSKQQPGEDGTVNKAEVKNSLTKQIQQAKDAMKVQQRVLSRDIKTMTNWLKGNEDIGDAEEVANVKARLEEKQAQLDDINQRQQKWAEIRDELMTKEEKQQFEAERRKEVFDARTGYTPADQKRKTSRNEQHLEENEDGTLNIGRTPTNNVNNYLLKNYENEKDAEKFMIDQRLALRNLQRDEVQPQINDLNDQLNDFISGKTELEPVEIKQMVQQLADLETYQDALSEEAAHLKEITDGIPALYERNGRGEELTPAEQRAEQLAKVTSKEDKVKLAASLYNGYPEALDVINNQEPRDIDEFIAANLGLNTMNWEGYDQGNRHVIGLQEALFGKNGGTRGIGKQYSTNAFNMYLAPTGEGKGFDEIVHSIYESQPDLGDGKRWTTEEIRDGLLDLLRTAQKPSDISHRIINNRIAEAEDIVRQQEEYDREMEEMAKSEEMQQWADANHLTPEERETFEEFAKQAPTEIEQEIINKLLENEADEQNSRSNAVDLQPTNEPVGGEDQGSQGEVRGQSATEEVTGYQNEQGSEGTEAGNGVEAISDTDVSGGAQVGKITNDVNGNTYEEKKDIPLQKAIQEVDSEIEARPNINISSEESLQALKGAGVGEEILDVIREDLADDSTIGRYVPELGSVILYGEKMERLGLTQVMKKANIYHENIHALGSRGFTKEDFAETARLIDQDYQGVLDEVIRDYADQDEEIQNEEVVARFVQSIVNGGPLTDFLNGEFKDGSSELCDRINNIAKLLRGNKYGKQDANDELGGDAKAQTPESAERTEQGQDGGSKEARPEESESGRGGLELSELSDEELLSGIGEKDGEERRLLADEYDRRHETEQIEQAKVYSDMLYTDVPQLELAQEMYDNTWAAFKNAGYASPDRTKLLAQLEALEGHIEYLEEVEEERKLAEQDQEEQESEDDFSARLAEAKAETNTNPTEAQKEAGNYRKPELKFGGYTFRIENPKGSIRSGVDANGKKWSQEMKDTYGYIEEKTGKDGDKMDFFINDDADLDNWNGRVFIIDQKNEDGSFDEHKVMYGYPSLRAAREAYKRNYEEGWWDKHVMQIMGVKKADFDKWLDDSDHKIKPFSEYFRTKILKDVVTDDVDQVMADMKERQQLQQEVKSQYDEKQLAKMDITTMSQLKKKAKHDAATSRTLLKTTNVKAGSKKEKTLQANIAQAEADIQVLDEALTKLRSQMERNIENAEAGGAMIDHMEDMGIDVSTNPIENRRARKRAEDDNSEEGKMREMRTSTGAVYGFTYRGKLYLDPRKLNAELPLHEYGHLWAEAFRRINPEGWKDVVKVMKQDADTWEFVKKINPELKDENDIAEEVITTGSGKRGEEKIRAEFERMNKKDPSYKSKWNNIWKNISKAIQDFWKKIGDFLRIKYETPEQVYDQVLRDFANGVNPRKKIEEYLKERDKDYDEAVRRGDIQTATRIFNEALKENVGNGMTPFVAVDKYRRLQGLAHKIKDGDAEGIEKAAKLMAPLIPANAVLIPAPSHKGKATTMLKLANAIAERTGSEVADILTGSSRASQYEAKYQGKVIPSKEMGIKVTGELPEGKIPVVIDNVVDTGNTAEACVRALGTGIVASLADSTELGRRVASLRSAAPIIANKQGEVVPLSERFDLSRREKARPVEDINSVMEEVQRRNDEAQAEQEVQAAIMNDKEVAGYKKKQSKVRERATKAVLQAMDDAKVPVKQVTREEADQMMKLFGTLNHQSIFNHAKSIQPNEHKRWAVVDIRNPYGVPRYFEKKEAAIEYKVWLNRAGGLCDLMDLNSAAAGESVALGNAADIMPEIDTWHGSGAVFTKFDHSHMGEGAGSQSFGWGTYLTDSRRIGSDYARMLNRGWTYQGKHLDDIKPIYDGKNHKSSAIRDILVAMNHGDRFKDAKERNIRFIKSAIRDYEDEIQNLSEEDKQDLNDLREILAYVESLKIQDFKKDPENLYKVEIPEDTGENYLSYMETIKKPLRRRVADAVRSLEGEPRQSFVYANYKNGWNSLADMIEREQWAYKEIEDRLLQAFGGKLADAEKVSKLMMKAGFVGVKYPAGTIFGGGDGATNYVIFNEDDAKIVEHIQFMFDEPEVQEHPIFVSNALKAVEAIKQEKATPDQWLAMIQKNGGLKAGEDKWIGLSDWLTEQKKSGKSVTKQEVMDYIRENQIEMEEVPYREYFNMDDNPKMKEFRKEFDDLREKYYDESNKAWRDTENFNQEMNAKYGYGWANKLDEADQKRSDEITERYKKYVNESPSTLAFQEMVDKYGDDFELGFYVDYGSDTLEPNSDMYDEGISDAAKHFLELNDQPINDTRLNYTTAGLDNKREIAITVPTIEPYNASDEIHFGDAGEGRAVVWVRFGDATAPIKEDVVKHADEFEAPYDNGRGYTLYYPKGTKPGWSKDYIVHGKDKDGKDFYRVVIAEATIGVYDNFEEAQKNMNLYFQNHPKQQITGSQKVLVIDEIQSKRHQDARENGGYENNNTEKEWRAANDRRAEYMQSLYAKYPSAKHYEELEASITPEETEKLNQLDKEERELYDKYLEDRNKVPAAPFEKNWHELAMKRMLRYAAENGYDKIAWTTGQQQAERYDLGGVIESINAYPHSDPMTGEIIPEQYDVFVKDKNGEYIHEQGIEGVLTKEQILQNFGKDLGARIIKEADEHPDGTAEISGDGLFVGGEGMKGFYDEILPRFMNKYGKKWGVKVDKVELPALEGSAQKMWSIDVTPEMKESVMQGQPMFQKGQGGRVYGWTDGKEIFLTPEGMNPNTPIHEYTHIWDKYVQKHDPGLWKEMVKAFKKTDMWKQIRENPNYRSIWDDDDRMTSEVHARLSGQTGEFKFTEAAKDETKDSRSIINEVKRVLKKFWDAIARLFGHGKVTDDRLSEFVNMPLRDLLRKFNPVDGDRIAAEPMKGDTMEKTLMGVHNISEEKLKKALKLGGLANPSMAVIDTKNGIHTDYGEISLIPKSSLIDAKTGRNAGTYAGDAWTPTYPGVTKELTKQGEKHKNQIAKDAADGNVELEQHLASTMERYIDDNENRLHLLYLLQKGIKPELIPQSTIHTHEEYEELRKILGNDQLRYSSDGLTDEQNDAILDLMMKGVREKAEEASKLINDEEKRKKSVELMVNMRKNNLVDPETGKIWFAKYDTYIYDVLRDEKRRQNPMIDWYKTDNEASYRVAKENLAEDYEAWKEKLFGDEDIAEKLFAGWTADGNKRYVKNTVENASRLMNKEKDTNAYGNGGLSASKAMLVKKLKTLAEIRKYRHLIKKGDDIKEQLKQKEDEWFDIIQQVSQMQKVDNNRFINNDIAEARLQEAMEQRDPIAYMNKEYGYHIDKDGELASQLMNFMEEASQIPVKYFETKFKRPVGIEEFAIAVVPTTTSPDVIKALKEKGLEVHTYEKGSTGDENDEARKLAVMNAVMPRTDILFDIEGQEVGSLKWGNLFKDEDFEAPAKKETNDFDPTQVRLRKLEPGETCLVERRYKENGYFDFTGSEKIESIDDVAYIFKQLEEEAIENSFLAMIKDGKPTIIHLATGHYTGVVAGASPALAAYHKLNPDKVYFVHNHPSGRVVASKQDENIMRYMRNIFGDKLQPGIIINTTSGKYGIFEEDEIRHSHTNKMPTEAKDEISIKTYSFGKSVFDKDWNPEQAFAGGTAGRIAEFVSSHRLGEHKKMSLIVMAQNWAVTGNVFLPWTELSEATTKEAADLIAYYMNQMGGTIVTLYGNYKYGEKDKKNVYKLSKLLKDRDVYLADVVHIDQSMLERGLMAAEEMPGEMMAGEPVTDNAELERLEQEPKAIGYRNVVMNEDGTLGSPMANRLGKKGVGRKATSMFEFGQWERSDENPELATDEGKIDLIKPDGKTVDSVDYNPYIHIRPTLVNKQFKQAWERPNLVYVRTEYPESELTSDYHAEKAKLSVGKHPWNGGELILSRYDKPVEIVPWEEVADDWVKEFEGTEGIHFDIIPPKLLPILAERGITILPPHKGMGKACTDAYKEFKNERYRKDTPAIERVNAEFNKRLDELESDKNQKNRVLKLGMPSSFLLAGGVMPGEIRLEYDKFVKKSSENYKNNHPFTADDIKNLPKAINAPIAVFRNTNHKDDFVILTELKKDNNNFIVAIRATEQPRKGGVILNVNEIETLLPKKAKGIVYWIMNNKHTQVDKEKALRWITALRPHVGTAISSEELNRAAKIVKDFENPTISEKNLRKIYANYVEAAEDTAKMLGGEDVIFETEPSEEGTLGWYDPNDHTVHVVLPEHNDVEEVKRTVCHEKLGHEGLVALMGDQKKVDDFGRFIWKSASADIRRKMVDKMEEEGWNGTDWKSQSKAAQEVFADIAADGPKTEDEFSLWTKVKHYLIKLCKALNIRVKGLLNDHDLRYYVLKTGEALKRWSKLTPEQRAEMEAQEMNFDVMRATGKPRKKNGESQAQYFQRLREWERRRIIEEKDPEPKMPQLDDETINREYGEYRRGWLQRHELPEDYEAQGMPTRRQGESDEDYMDRIRVYERYSREVNGDEPLQPQFGWEPEVIRQWKQNYAEWKQRNDIREEESVDLNLYEGRGIVPEGDPVTESEVDARMLQDLGYGSGADITPEGAKRQVKLAIIERRKDLESSNAEDAIFIHNLKKEIARVAKLQGVTPEELNRELPHIIEGTYFEEVLRDDTGEVVTINDISDQLPIKKTPELQQLLNTIKAWYDNFYHVLEEAGLRNEVGYIENGYVNHVWDKEKSDPKAYEKYVEQYQRMKSPNMKHRVIDDYRMGIDVGLKPKFDYLTDMMAYYSKSNNEALANNSLMQHLSCLNVEELNSDGDVVLRTPLLMRSQPDAFVRDRYETFYVPGIGDIWVYKEAASKFANVFGPLSTPGEKSVSQKFWKGYDLIGSTAKKIQLSWSFFHAGALTEVYLAQGMAGEGPVRALKELFRSLVYKSIIRGEMPAMAHPEDFKAAASHLVKLGATDDYAAADVLRLTDKFREFAYKMDMRLRKAAEIEDGKKNVAGPLGVAAFVMHAINKGMDSFLWSYLHDGLKIAMFKMMKEDLEIKARKNDWTAEKLDQMLDEAGQYVNDCFGGQYWELIDVSPKLLKGLQRMFLSPDWLLSTQRHFFANFGFGSLYSDGGFWEYVRYNWDNLRRMFGANIPKNELRSFRSSNAKMCYIVGVLFGAMLLSNMANALFRKMDEEKDRREAEEIRKNGNPNYKSKYELIAPDGMKWTDYLMMGNANGQTTHMFTGRYEDGTETYIRWGKQFREFPELWTNEKGELEVPWPLVKRMMGKANPNIGIILDDITYLDPYKAKHQDEEIQRKYGKALGLIIKTAEKFMPFIVPTQEGKEWKVIDLVFPSSKGFSKWKAQDYFKHYILTNDQQGMEMTYRSCILNGIDPDKQLEAAIRSVKAAQREEMADGVKDLQGAWDKFNGAKNVDEKLYWQRKLKKYLAEENYDQLNAFEFGEKAKELLNGYSDAESKAISKENAAGYDGMYLMKSKAEDVRDDYKLTVLYKKSGEIVSQLKQMEEDGKDTSDFEERNSKWLEIRRLINEYRRDFRQLKTELGEDRDSEVMKQIREERTKLLNDIEQME